MRNTQYLENIYRDVKALGLVANQYDFSVLCGRTPAWFSAIKARGLPITPDAMLTLSYNLRCRASDVLNLEASDSAVMLSERLVGEAQELIGQKVTKLSLAKN